MSPGGATAPGVALLYASSGKKHRRQLFSPLAGRGSSELARERTANDAIENRCSFISADPKMDLMTFWHLGGCPRTAIVARARLIEPDFSEKRGEYRHI
jgi:hypothetical protein